MVDTKTFGRDMAHAYHVRLNCRGLGDIGDEPLICQNRSADA